MKERLERNEKQTKEFLDQNALVKLELDSINKKFVQAEIDHKLSEQGLRSKIHELRNQIAQLQRENMELENKFNMLGAQYRGRSFSRLSGVIVQAKPSNHNVDNMAQAS